MKRQIDRMEVFSVEMPLMGTFTSAGISKQVTKCVVVRLTAVRRTAVRLEVPRVLVRKGRTWNLK